MAEVEHDHEAEVILYEVAISLAGSLMYWLQPPKFLSPA